MMRTTRTATRRARMTSRNRVSQKKLGFCLWLLPLPANGQAVVVAEDPAQECDQFWVCPTGFQVIERGGFEIVVLVGGRFLFHAIHEELKLGFADGSDVTLVGVIQVNHE